MKKILILIFCGFFIVACDVKITSHKYDLKNLPASIEHVSEGVSGRTVQVPTSKALLLLSQLETFPEIRDQLKISKSVAFVFSDTVQKKYKNYYRLAFAHLSEVTGLNFVETTIGDDNANNDYRIILSEYSINYDVQSLETKHRVLRNTKDGVLSLRCGAQGFKPEHQNNVAQVQIFLEPDDLKAIHFGPYRPMVIRCMYLSLLSVIGVHGNIDLEGSIFNVNPEGRGRNIITPIDYAAIKLYFQYDVIPDKRIK